ncbi:aminoglycoside phosphotransferase family protein [Alicyclobacillus shizuokensis]|uniref:aminoglycoside phosphotransferase family protein n=1 Tax=Alicyclobacillus shizuokensis TaxID=392014 RepID=UPI000833912A|nr:aminoglycoside phosphotransferase family protein [Alicyclobacillus shizuokensis]
MPNDHWEPDWLDIASPLSIEVQRVQPIACTAQATVVRLVPRHGLPLIVKASHNHAAIRREAALYETCVRHLPVCAPQVAGSGQSCQWAWIAYRDDQLVPITTRRHGILLAVAAAARLHQADLPAGEARVALSSHTPDLAEVLRQTLAVDPAVFAATMAAGGWASAARRQVCQLHRRMESWGEELMLRPRVLCHGDLHLGNLMWSRAYRQPAVIDWEFLHPDYDYFDLFQLLDATSPTTPLWRPLGRRRVLLAYARARSDLRERTATWLRGYLRFAAIHLLWIATRIHADRETARHPEEELNRQERETYAGLLSIARELRRL